MGDRPISLWGPRLPALLAAALILGPVVGGNPAAAAPSHHRSGAAGVCGGPSGRVISCPTLSTDPSGLSIDLTQSATVLGSGESLAGFGIGVSNSAAAGTATAIDVNLTDALPAEAGIDWSTGYEGPGTCAVTGPVGSQVLDCAFGDLAAAASVSVGVWTETNDAEPGTFSNMATATAANEPSVSASDTWVLASAPALSVGVTADASTVSVGSPIGFSVTIANSSDENTATAADVTMNDPLPSGSGMDWSISPYDGPGSCSVSGATGSQVLTCSLGDMAPGSSTDLHLESPTDPTSGGTYVNTITATTTTDKATVSADATVVVEAPALSVTVTTPDDFVASGAPLLYGIFVANSSSAGTLTATDVTVNDPLPSGPGIDWTFLSAGDGCTVKGPLGTQVLDCDVGDMAPGARASVTVGSDTTAGSDGPYLDTATVSATNSVTAEASASVIVTTDAITSPAHVTVETRTPLSFSITTTGVPVPSITEKGGLPKYVTFVDNGDGTATISGTPRVRSRRTFHLTITATYGTFGVATQQLSLRMDPSSSRP